MIMAIAILRTLDGEQKGFAKLGIQYLDCGTSGGVLRSGPWILSYGWGYRYCSIRLSSLFDALAPGINAAERLAGRDGYVLYPEEFGWMYCGGPGAGHFVEDGPQWC